MKLVGMLVSLLEAYLLLHLRRNCFRFGVCVGGRGEWVGVGEVCVGGAKFDSIAQFSISCTDTLIQTWMKMAFIYNILKSKPDVKNFTMESNSAPLISHPHQI